MSTHVTESVHSLMDRLLPTFQHCTRKLGGESLNHVTLMHWWMGDLNKLLIISSRMIGHCFFRACLQLSGIKFVTN